MMAKPVKSLALSNDPVFNNIKYLHTLSGHVSRLFTKANFSCTATIKNPRKKESLKSHGFLKILP